VLPFADTSGTFRFRTHDQELFFPRRVSPVDRIERATSAVAEMQPRRLGKAVCEGPSLVNCSPAVHQEAGTGRFRREQIGSRETRDRARSRDSIEECGVLRVKGRSETRFMSPLLYQLSYTATSLISKGLWSCPPSATTPNCSPTVHSDRASAGGVPGACARLPSFEVIDPTTIRMELQCVLIPCSEDLVKVPAHHGHPFHLPSSKARWDSRILIVSWRWPRRAPCRCRWLHCSMIVFSHSSSCFQADPLASNWSPDTLLTN
jgi:hypothetical protein